MDKYIYNTIQCNVCTSIEQKIDNRSAIDSLPYELAITMIKI